MAMYECTQCGDENSCFPQVIVGLNSKIDYGYDGIGLESFIKRYDNLFDNKFKEFALEISKSMGMSVQTIEREYNKEIWNKFNNWLILDGNRGWFCSIECAIKWLANKEALDDYSI